MPVSDALHAGVAFGGAFVAGMINSVAGGGTLVSFPALIWLGFPSVTANATSTVAIWPGTLGGMCGYRRELVGGRAGNARILVAPSLSVAIRARCCCETPPPRFDSWCRC